MERRRDTRLAVAAVAAVAAVTAATLVIVVALLLEPARMRMLP